MSLFNDYSEYEDLMEGSIDIQNFLDENGIKSVSEKTLSNVMKKMKFNSITDLYFNWGNVLHDISSLDEWYEKSAKIKSKSLLPYLQLIVDILGAKNAQLAIRTLVKNMSKLLRVPVAAFLFHIPLDKTLGFSQKQNKMLINLFANSFHSQVKETKGDKDFAESFIDYMTNY